MGEDTVPEVFRPHLCVVRPARKCFLPTFPAENIPYLHFFFRDSFFIFHLNQVLPLPCLTSQSLHLIVTHWCCWDLTDMTLANLELNCCIFQCCYMDLSNLSYGFVKFVTWICQSCYRISHTFPSLFFESPAVQNVFLTFLLLLLFCSQDKKNGAKIMHVMHRLLVFVHSLLFLFASLLELFPWEKRKDLLLLPLLMEDL